MGLYDEWAYTQEVTITNNTASDLTDFQVAIDLDDTWQGWGNVNADGSDIRFSTQDGGTAIPYWIESWDFTNKTARIWVKVPSIPASGSTTILMYWGKADAVSESDGSAVFEFFDDFEGDSLNTDVWDVVAVTGDNGKTSTVSASDVCVQNSYAWLDCQQKNINVGIVEKVKTFTAPYITETKARQNPDNLDDDVLALIFAYQDYNKKYQAVICFGDTGWGASTALAGDNPDANETWDEPTRTTPKDGNWHHIRVDFYSADGTTAKARYYLDGSLVSDASTTNPYYDGGKIGLASNGLAGGAQFDWVFVRKYAESEPTVALGTLTSKWLTGWSHRNKITINNPNAEDLTDFQVAIDLDDTWDGWLLVKSDGSDIRVTDAGGSTLLPHWIEEFDTTNKTARIWVKVPSIPASGSVDVYLYYGNPDATDASDAHAVFPVFDDFNDNAIGTEWTVAYGSATETDGKILTESDTSTLLYQTTTIHAGHVLEASVKPVESNAAPGIIFAMQDTDNFFMARINDANRIEIHKNAGGTFTTLKQESATISLNWYALKVIWKDDGTVKVEVYGASTDRFGYDYSGLSLVGSAEYTTPADWLSGYVGLRSYKKGAYDWVRVRKFAESEPTFTIAAREDLQTVYTFYKRVKLILNDDASNEDVELIIDDKFKAFWANRGVELAIVKDGDDTRLPHTINSETTDHISITAHGVTGVKGDIYWLYFDDGQERDTSNLDDTFAPANLAKRFSIDYILPGEPYVIYDVTFSGFAGKLAESDLTNLTVVDGNTNTVVAHKVVSYEKDGSGAVTSLRLQVRAAYATDTRTFYLYLVGKGQTFDTPDTYIYPVASTGWALLWEKKSVGVSTSILLDGNSFNVTEYDVGYRRNTYHFDIEEGESYNLPSSNYSRVFRLRLVATDDELSTLHTIMKRPYILVDWLGEEFYGQIIELRYRKNARRPMVYDVELTVERVRVV